MRNHDTGAQTAVLLQADDPFANTTVPVCTPIAGVPGLLNYDQIVLLLSYAEVLTFNSRSNVRVELSASSFYVDTPGHPQYVFNEDAAPDAVLNGHLFWMPDAQGFGCTFELDCVVDPETLNAGEVDG